MTQICEWIGMDDSTCDKEARDGSAYCAEHHERCYQKGSSLPKRKKDIKRAAEIREWESLINEVADELMEEGQI